MIPSSPSGTIEDLPWYAPLWDVEENTPYLDVPELDDEFDDWDVEDPIFHDEIEEEEDEI